MTAYKNEQEPEKCTHGKELKAIREEIGFSVRDMAAELKLKAATYQCYENGSRECPYPVIEAARISLYKVRAFAIGQIERIDAEINRRHPHGILSGEVDCDGWDALNI